VRESSERGSEATWTRGSAVHGEAAQQAAVEIDTQVQQLVQSGYDDVAIFTI
jgi:hypothetical protein